MFQRASLANVPVLTSVSEPAMFSALKMVEGPPYTAVVTLLETFPSGPTESDVGTLITICACAAPAHAITPHATRIRFMSSLPCPLKAIRHAQCGTRLIAAAPGAETPAQIRHASGYPSPRPA